VIQGAVYDTTDADARFHAALLQVHTGASKGTGCPGRQHSGRKSLSPVWVHYPRDRRPLSQGEKALGESYTQFLKHYDEEMKANRPEYEEHRTSVENFRTGALEGRKKQT
jgi:hypothetical protein